MDLLRGRIIEKSFLLYLLMVSQFRIFSSILFQDLIQFGKKTIHIFASATFNFIEGIGPLETIRGIPWKRYVLF